MLQNCIIRKQKNLTIFQGGGNRYLPYNLIEQNYINNLVLEDHEKLN